MSRPFILDVNSFSNAITLHYLQKLPTLVTMLIVDITSGRFMYQSGRVGDEAEKRKSPAQSGRVCISARHTKMQFLSRIMSR